MDTPFQLLFRNSLSSCLLQLLTAVIILYPAVTHLIKISEGSCTKSFLTFPFIMENFLYHQISIRILVRLCKESRSILYNSFYLHLPFCNHRRCSQSRLAYLQLQPAYRIQLTIPGNCWQLFVGVCVYRTQQLQSRSQEQPGE